MAYTPVYFEFGSAIGVVPPLCFRMCSHMQIKATWSARAFADSVPVALKTLHSPWLISYVEQSKHGTSHQLSMETVFRFYFHQLPANAKSFAPKIP